MLCYLKVETAQEHDLHSTSKKSCTEESETHVKLMSIQGQAVCVFGALSMVSPPCYILYVGRVGADVIGLLCCPGFYKVLSSFHVTGRW